MALDRNSELTADHVAKASVGFGIASIVTILVPMMPLILGTASVMASAYAKRLRGSDPSGPEGHGLVLGCIGMALGVLMLGFYVYAYGKVREG